MNFLISLLNLGSCLAILNSSLTDKGFKYLEKYELINGFINAFEL